MFYQDELTELKDSRGVSVGKKYGCMICSTAFFHPHFPIMTPKDGDAIVSSLLKNGLVSGDLNKDGDFDDAKEFEIQDHQKVLDFLGCRYQVVFRGDIYTARTKLSAGDGLILQMFSPAGGTHFVVAAPVKINPGELVVVYDSAHRDRFSNAVNNWLASGKKDSCIVSARVLRQK